MILETASTRIIEPTTSGLATLETELRTRAVTYQDDVHDVRDIAWNDDDTLSIPGRHRANITELAFRQLCNKLKVPADYIQRLEPDLRAANITRALRDAHGDTLIRTEGGDVRGLLGPRYAAVNHLDLVQGLLSRYPDATARYELTASALDIQIIQTGTAAGDMIPGSALKGGLHVRNSEVGLSKLRLEGFVMRTICLNGMVLSAGSGAYARVHVGDSGAILREALGQVAAATADPQAAASRFAAAWNIGMGGNDKGPAVLRTIGSHFGLTKPQEAAAVEAFGTEPGDRLYHVLQALTWAGTHSDLPQDGRLQLQTVAGSILGNIENGRRWLN